MIEPIAFIVPRKVRRVFFLYSNFLTFLPALIIQSDSFQSDIYPPATSVESSLTASEFYSGKPAYRKLVSLDSGIVFQSSATATAPAPSPLPTSTAFAASPSSTVQPAAASLAPHQFKTPTRSHTAPEHASEQVQAPSLATRSQSNDQTSGSHPISEREEGGDLDVIGSLKGDSSSGLGELQDENEKLWGELRDAREKIRNLELQVEGLRANARKVAQTLLES